MGNGQCVTGVWLAGGQAPVCWSSTAPGGLVLLWDGGSAPAFRDES